MQEKKLWQDLLEHENYFNDPVSSCIAEDETFQIELERLYIGLNEDMHTLSEMVPQKQLHLIFERSLNCVISYNKGFLLFNSEPSLYESVLNACFFTGLCLFLHNTKRERAKTLTQYVYQKSSKNYNIKETGNYFDPKYQKSGNSKRTMFDAEASMLRQYRHRLFKQRPVDTRAPEWSAMPRDSEHEWSLWWKLNDSLTDSKVDPKISQTLKRVKNLYSNNIFEAIKSAYDGQYKERVETAYNKFYSKLNKIQYADYLELCKYCLEHINKDKEFYGINLYRFEKELRLFEISNDVNCLLNCNDENAEVDFLDRCIATQNIPFPLVRKDLRSLPSLKDVRIFADMFTSFMDEVIYTSRLIIDKFVENGVFGENWVKEFISITNDMASEVFYESDLLDYTVKQDSQEAFIKVMLAPVYNFCSYHILMWENRPS